MPRKNSLILWRGAKIAAVAAVAAAFVFRVVAQTQTTSVPLSAGTVGATMLKNGVICAPNFVCHLSGGLFYVDSTTKVTVVNAAICAGVQYLESAQAANKASGQDQAMGATDSGLQALRTACELGSRDAH